MNINRREVFKSVSGVTLAGTTTAESSLTTSINLPAMMDSMYNYIAATNDHNRLIALKMVLQSLSDQAESKVNFLVARQGL